MIDACTPITITSPGTPQQVTIPAAPTNRVYAISIQALPSNTGKIWIGKSTMKKGASPPSGVMAVLAVPTTNIIPSFSASIALAAGGITATDFWIDADNMSDGVVIAILTT